MTQTATGEIRFKGNEAYKRKLFAAGKYLRLVIPAELKRSMHIAKGNVALIRPINDKTFVVEFKRST